MVLLRPLVLYAVKNVANQTLSKDLYEVIVIENFLRTGKSATTYGG